MFDITFQQTGYEYLYSLYEHVVVVTSLQPFKNVLAAPHIILMSRITGIFHQVENLQNEVETLKKASELHSCIVRSYCPKNLTPLYGVKYVTLWGDVSLHCQLFPTTRYIL